jgi:hypothetical protein
MNVHYYWKGLVSRSHEQIYLQFSPNPGRSVVRGLAMPEIPPEIPNLDARGRTYGSVPHNPVADF